MSKTGLTRDGRYRMALGSRIRYGRTATRIGNWREQRAWARGKHEMARAHPEPGKRHRMSIRARVSDWRADRTVERGRRDVFRRGAAMGPRGVLPRGELRWRLEIQLERRVTQHVISLGDAAGRRDQSPPHAVLQLKRHSRPAVPLIHLDNRRLLTGPGRRAKLGTRLGGHLICRLQGDPRPQLGPLAGLVQPARGLEHPRRDAVGERLQDLVAIGEVEVGDAHQTVVGAGQQQVRFIWANIGAFHICLWTFTLTEAWEVMPAW